MELLPLPGLSMSRGDFSAVVQAFDKIRAEVTTNSESDEFWWFAREYPRCYLHHLDHAQFRLASIYDKYQSMHAHFSTEVDNLSDELGVWFSYTDQTVRTVYWDFEAYLAAISSALDILARLVGLAYQEQTPPSFNKICKKNYSSGPAATLRRARDRWVSRLKDYRDCFVHYTPVETLLTISAVRFLDGCELRCKLPVNPNVRDILGFRYSRRAELLRYSVTVYRHTRALDRRIAYEILRMHGRGEFPKRTNHLLFVGSRSRPRG